MSTTNKNQPFQNDNVIINASESALYKTLLEELPDPLLLLDQNGNILMTNQVLLTYMGLEANDVVNTNASLLINGTKDELLNAIHKNSRKLLRTTIRINHSKNIIDWNIKQIRSQANTAPKILLLGKARSRTRKQHPLLRILKRKLRNPFRHPGYKNANNLHINSDFL